MEPNGTASLGDDGRCSDTDDHPGSMHHQSRGGSTAPTFGRACFFKMNAGGVDQVL